MNLPLAKEFIRFKKLITEELASHREFFYSVKNDFKNLENRILILENKIEILHKDNEKESMEQWINNFIDEELEIDDGEEIGG